MNLSMIGNIVQLVGSIALLYSYIPQIAQILRTKKSGDISTQFWAILTIGLSCIAVNMYISKVPIFILLTQIANSILALITLVLVVKYKKN